MKTALLVATIVCALFMNCEGTSSYPRVVVSSLQTSAASESCNSFALATLIVKKCVDLPKDFPRDCCAAVYLALGQEGCICAVKDRGFFHASPLDDKIAMDVVMGRCRASPSMYSILHGCDEAMPPQAPKSPSGPLPPPMPSSPAEETSIAHPSKPPAASHTSTRSSSSKRCTSCWFFIFLAIAGWTCAAGLFVYIMYSAVMEFLNHDWYQYHHIVNEEDEGGEAMDNEDEAAEVNQDDDVGPGEVMQTIAVAAELIHDKDVAPDIEEPVLVAKLELAMASIDTPTATGSFASGSQSYQSQGELGLQMASPDTLHLAPTATGSLFAVQSDKSQGVVDSQDLEISSVDPSTRGHLSKQDATTVHHCTWQNKQGYKEQALRDLVVQRKTVAAKAVPPAVPHIEMQCLGVEKCQVDTEKPNFECLGRPE